MKLALKIIIAALTLQTITSCEALKNFGSQKPKELAPIDYLEKAPKVDVRSFLNGNLEGFAIMQDPEGKIKDSFTIKADGSWEGSRGTVRYNYTYVNGKKDSRTWLITVNDHTSYSAIGHDFIETALGRSQGNSSVVNYALNMAFETQQKERIDFEDHLYVVDEDSAIIISTMKQKNTIVGKAIIALKKIK